MIARYKKEGQEKGTGITCIDQHLKEWMHDTDDSRRERERERESEADTKERGKKREQEA